MEHTVRPYQPFLCLDLGTGGFVFIPGLCLHSLYPGLVLLYLTEWLCPVHDTLLKVRSEERGEAEFREN